MIRKWFFPLLLFLLLSACTLTTPPEIITPPLPNVHSKPRFQVFILTPLTTCLVGNEFASGNVCAGTACGDCSCAWEENDPPAPQVGLPPERINDRSMRLSNIRSAWR